MVDSTPMAVVDATMAVSAILRHLITGIGASLGIYPPAKNA